MSGSLVVLVPDKDIEQSILGLFDRPEALGVQRPSKLEVIIHPNRDPGVYHTGHELLVPFVGECDHALVCLDLAWEGAPTSDRKILADQILNKCEPWWLDRVRCIVIEPEVEVWVWSDSPHVADSLGWASHSELQSWLQEQGLWSVTDPKPADPKQAFLEALRQKRIPPSSSIFRQLAGRVSFKRCSDAAFQELISVLRQSFPRLS